MVITCFQHFKILKLLKMLNVKRTAFKESQKNGFKQGSALICQVKAEDTMEAGVSVLLQLSGGLGKPMLGGDNIHFLWIGMNLQLDKTVFCFFFYCCNNSHGQIRGCLQNSDNCRSFSYDLTKWEGIREIVLF